MGQAARRDIAEQVVAAAAARGATLAFGVPGGGSNLDVAGACDRHGIRFVLTHLEAAAAIMAGVAGALTGAPAIAVATRGPGAVSAANGLANALLERQPMLLVTDCVYDADRARVSHQRVDQRAALEPLCVGSTALNGRDPALADAAVAQTLVQPPGPVHVDIDPTAHDGHLAPRRACEPTDLTPLLARIASARRPVIVAGLGMVTLPPAVRDAAVRTLRELARQHHVPVLTTYLARGVVPDGAEYSAGIVTGGTIEGHALRAADLILGVGLDPVEFLPTAWDYPAPVVNVTGWRIDDARFFGAALEEEAIGDLAEVLPRIASVLDVDWQPGSGQHYWRLLQAAARSTIGPVEQGLTPGEVVQIAAELAPEDSIATVDAGAHMLVAMPLWPVGEPLQALISSGYATMGFSLPAAIAASLVRPERAVIAFTGDGGAGMVLGELETLARLGLPVVVIVFNDSALSLIAVKQEPQGHSGPPVVTFAPTDFAAIATGCGVASWTATTTEEYRDALTAALALRGPALIDVHVDPRDYPGIFAALRE